MKNKPTLQPQVNTGVRLRVTLIKYAVVGSIAIALLFAAGFLYFNLGTSEESSAFTPTENAFFVIDFATSVNGTKSTSQWNTDISNANPLKFEVFGSKFEAQHLRGEAILKTINIPIAEFGNVRVAVEIEEASGMESSDYVKTYYSIDSGPEVQFGTNGSLTGNFTARTISQEGIRGDSVRVIMKMNNNSANEIFRVKTVTVSGANYLYYENFDSYNNSVTTSAKWVIDVTGASVNPLTDLIGGILNILWVQSGGLEAKDVDGVAVWTSSVIDISSIENAKAEVSLSETGEMEGSDYVKVYYIVDGGQPQLFSNYAELTDDFSSATAYEGAISGSTLQIQIRISNDAPLEIHRIESVLVYPEAPAPSWLGNSSDDWHNAANWETGQIPTDTTNVTILAGTVYNLVVSGKAVCNNLTIQPGASLSMLPGDTLIIKGNFVNNGSLSTTGATVIFDGTEEQSLTGNGTSTFSRLDINNTSSTGLSLGHSITITTQLNLIDGHLNTNGDTVFITNTGDSSLIVYSDTSHIVGYLRRYIAENDVAYAFPLGYGNKEGYYLAEVINRGLKGVSYLTGTFGQLVNHDDKQLYVEGYDFFVEELCKEGMWTIEPDAQPTGGAYNMEVTIDNFAGLRDNLFVLVKRPTGGDATMWSKASGEIDGINGEGRLLEDGFALLSLLNSFSDFGVGGGGGGGGLPITLDYFAANLQDDGTVLCDWSSHTELNNDYYTVERSTDGRNFEVLGKVQGAGTVSTKSYYDFVDDAPASGVNYYRLSQTDFDGSREYFKIVAVRVGELQGSGGTVNVTSVGPNPFKNSFWAEFDAEKDGVGEIQILNASGRTVHRETININTGSNRYSFTEQQNLPGGMYLMTIIQDNNNSEMIKLIKSNM